MHVRTTTLTQILSFSFGFCSILIFTFGVFLGLILSKCCTKPGTSAKKTVEMPAPPAAYYEEVIIQQNTFKLKDNVAYEPVILPSV